MTYSTRDIATADLSLIENTEYHIDDAGIVHIDGKVYTLDQVDTELAEREIKAVQSRYQALCRRPRSRHAWNAIACRLWNVMQGPANMALLPTGSPRRQAVYSLYVSANQRAEASARTGRAV